MKSYTRVSRKTAEEDRIAICPNFGCEYMKRVKPLKLGFIGFGKHPKCKKHSIPLVYIDERIIDFVDAALACLFDKAGLPPRDLLKIVHSKFPDKFRSFIEDWVYCITIGRGARIVSRYMDTISRAYLKQLTKKQIRIIKKGNCFKPSLVNNAIKDGMDEICIQYTRILKHLRAHSEVFNEPDKLRPLSTELKNELKNWQKNILKNNVIKNSPAKTHDMTLIETKHNYDEVLNVGICRCLLGQKPESKNMQKTKISAFDRFSAYFEFFNAGITSKLKKSSIEALFAFSNNNLLFGSFPKSLKQPNFSDNEKESKLKMSFPVLTVSEEDKLRLYESIKEEINKFKRGILPPRISEIWEKSFKGIMSREYFQKLAREGFPEWYKKIWGKGTGVRSSNELDQEKQKLIKRRIRLELNKEKPNSINEISKSLGVSFNVVKRKILNYLKELYGDNKDRIKQEYKKRWDDPRSDEVRHAQSRIIRDIIESKGSQMLSEYVDKSTPIKIKCKNGHLFEAKPEHLKKGSWCNNCFLDRKKEKAAYELKDLIESKGGKLLTDYSSAKEKVWIECSKGHKFPTKPDNIKSGYWCPKCASGKYQRIIIWYIEKIFSFILNKRLKIPSRMICDIINCSSLGPIPIQFDKYSLSLMHFDGYFTIKLGNELYKVAIEYNGPQHYEFPNQIHLETRQGLIKFQEQQERDEFKRFICKKQSIILFEFPYYVNERMNNPKKIQSYIVKNLVPKIFHTISKNIPQFNHTLVF